MRMKFIFGGMERRGRERNPLRGWKGMKWKEDGGSTSGLLFQSSFQFQIEPFLEAIKEGFSN